MEESTTQRAWCSAGIAEECVGGRKQDTADLVPAGIAEVCAGMDEVEDVVKRKGRGDRARVMRRGAVGGGYIVPAPNGGADPNGGNP